MSGRAGTLDFVRDMALEIGATFDGQIALTDDNNNPINLTGFTLLWQVREKTSSTSVLLQISDYCTIPTPANGIIVFNVPRTVTKLLTAIEGVTDLLLTQGTYGRFELRGKFQIAPTVSR